MELSNSLVQMLREITIIEHRLLGMTTLGIKQCKFVCASSTFFWIPSISPGKWHSMVWSLLRLRLEFAQNKWKGTGYHLTSGYVTKKLLSKKSQSGDEGLCEVGWTSRNPG